MNVILRSALALAGAALAAQAAAQVTLFEREGFEGRSFTTQEEVENLVRKGFNDRASSVIVTSDHWQVCEDTQYRGWCIDLVPGRYSSLAVLGFDNRVSSMRTVYGNMHLRTASEGRPYMSAPGASSDFSRRDQERLYEANVREVHTVVGPPEQRCWTEQEQVSKERRNVPGALVGALIGGILGHQIGGGSGQVIATAGGAVAGAAIGSNAGRDGEGRQVTTRDVQRCTTVPSQARPEYWDVIYSFRGREHRVQMTEPPGPTITVNKHGEPRE